MRKCLDNGIIGLMTITGNDLPTGHIEMLEFARRWSPYGGGDAEDILVEFGIGEREYFQRLTRILDEVEATAGDADLQLYASLRRVATGRLAS
jgi:hypothetical protein